MKTKQKIGKGQWLMMWCVFWTFATLTTHTLAAEGRVSQRRYMSELLNFNCQYVLFLNALQQQSRMNNSGTYLRKPSTHAVKPGALNEHTVTSLCSQCVPKQHFDCRELCTAR